MNCKIKKIRAKEVLDSRGNPTVEAEVFCDCCSASAIVPSGASTGKHEALELRDGGKRFNGKGVLKAVNNVNKVIAKKIIGMEPTKQKEIDELMIELDGTENKSRLGANAILSVSMAVCKAGAMCKGISLCKYIKGISKSKKISLPVPMLNVINGGRHAGIDNDVQEHMIMPVKFRNFDEAFRASTNVYNELKKILKKRFGPQGVLLGDEGGFVPKIDNVEERLELIEKAINNTGYKNKIFLAMDCAASEFFHKNHYVIRNKKYSSAKLIEYYEELIKKYPIISIEDGLAEDGWKVWQQLTKIVGKKIQIVGDDLLVTNVKRIKKAIGLKSCNALLLKVNQIGTVTEAIKAAIMAKKNKWNVIVSHRSGETEDSFIADLAVGLDAGQCKFGAPARPERLAKYNRLLMIEKEPGKKAVYAGKNFKL